jgi:hypothetical protein
MLLVLEICGPTITWRPHGDSASQEYLPREGGASVALGWAFELHLNITHTSESKGRALQMLGCHGTGVEGSIGLVSSNGPSEFHQMVTKGSLAVCDWKKL